MYIKVEPSGCREHKGLVQVRYSMYLEPGDYGYSIHHIHLETSPGVKVWQNNPFHNHFIYVKPETTDEDIINIGEELLRKAYTLWRSQQKPDLVNPKIVFPTVFDKAKVIAKVKHLTETKLERKL